mmetsp:Transcript_56094/g.130624  ORF Transcript_56094/g.130624 Transcript_56094/m.130624 type:complete len:172 (+) Transcript_56094:58-573(+)
MLSHVRFLAPRLLRAAPAGAPATRFASSFVERLGAAQKVVSTVNAAEAKEYISAKKPIIVDVRDSADVADGIKGAVNIPLSNLVFAADQDFALPEDVKVGDKVLLPKGTKFVSEHLKGAKDKPILVSCGLGGQALIGAQILVEYGYKEVKAVDGGNVAWLNSGGESCECMK